MTEKQKKILIIEDEGPIARMLNLKFHNIGFNAQMVHDGKEALDILKKNHFDLILLDLLLPKVDGFEILKKLKKMKINTPVIVSSNLSEKNFIDEAKKLGAVDYFIKAETPMAKVVEKSIKFLKVSPA
ncbi:sporulation initiation phosphotransferase F [bacterium BMS3Abin15]|nr:sporulation initiation phosphotransferase F [bacterium BMS3Abin15]